MLFIQGRYIISLIVKMKRWLSTYFYLFALLNEGRGIYCMMLLLEGVVSIYGTVCSVLACEGVFWSMMGSRKDAAVITFESLQVPRRLALLKTSVGSVTEGSVHLG